MYYVYAISSLFKEYIYIGLTKNINDRIARHNKGYEKTTRPFCPFKLIFKLECVDRIDARKQEKYWKSGCGKEQLKKPVISKRDPEKSHSLNSQSLKLANLIWSPESLQKVKEDPSKS